MDRTEVGLPATVFSTDGKSHRPKLEVPCRWITLHYTGAPRPKTTAARATVITEMQAIESNAVAQGKSNEYNYVIFAIDEGAVIVEYAGAFRAAHSEGENGQAVGVLFNLGCTKTNAKGHGVEFQSMPDSMVHAYRYLRDQVLRTFALTGLNTLEVFHRDMPDASTQCPGDSVLGRRADLLASSAITPLVSPIVGDGGVAVKAAAFAALPVVEPGDRGDAVRRVQALLVAAGLNPGDLDGKYFKTPTSPTRVAIGEFQRRSGLPATGVVAIPEWAHLLGVA
jgi:hypothetical protein